MREILFLLPREERVVRCLIYLDAPFWQQRAMACRVLRDERLSQPEVAAICQVICRRPHRALIELSARNAAELTTADAFEIVMPRLDKDYWRSRVVEALMPRPEVEIPRLVAEWPLPVLWAIARNGWLDYLPLIEEILEALGNDWDRLPIAVWALGKLGASRELNGLEHTIKSTSEWTIYWQMVDNYSDS